MPNRSRSIVAAAAALTMVLTACSSTKPEGGAKPSGSAGAEAGACMRRGLVVIGGSAGEGVGRASIAGTVVVFGTAGPNPGQWSKRGTIVALGPVTPPATYRYACTYRPQYLGLLLRHLGGRRVPVTREHLTGSYRRYSGDLAELGAGEILAWATN